MLMAGLDGIKNKIEPPPPVDKDLYELPPDELATVPQVPGSLEKVLDELEDDHDYLLEGGVFTQDVIDTWIDYKRINEVDPIRLRPHPYEFAAVLRHLTRRVTAELPNLMTGRAGRSLGLAIKMLGVAATLGLLVTGAGLLIAHAIGSSPSETVRQVNSLLTDIRNEKYSQAYGRFCQGDPNLPAREVFVTGLSQARKQGHGIDDFRISATFTKRDASARVRSRDCDVLGRKRKGGHVRHPAFEVLREREMHRLWRRAHGGLSGTWPLRFLLGVG